MIPGGHYVCSSHAREDDSTNDREERILAVLGIIGTILNLLVVLNGTDVPKSEHTRGEVPGSAGSYRHHSELTAADRVTGCFLVLCFSDLMWEPDTEQREKEQSLKLTGCCTRRERRLLQCVSNKENDQYATSIQGELEVFPNGCSISLRGETKSVLQRCVYMSDRAARRLFCGPIREENPGGESRPSAVQTDTECTQINRTTQLKLSPFIGFIHAQRHFSFGRIKSNLRSSDQKLSQI
uniref:Uncharacterized protein n=2 Tax=Nothobranchius pienaari TaxID=704102 RepID=A0A1A8QCF3_9TELE